MGALAKCPRCGGDGYVETGDYMAEAATRACGLCQANGDRAGADLGDQGTGWIALPLAPVAVAWLWEQGEDYCDELSYACTCGDCWFCAGCPAVWPPAVVSEQPRTEEQSMQTEAKLDADLDADDMAIIAESLRDCARELASQGLPAESICDVLESAERAARRATWLRSREGVEQRSAA